jgi:hypothetical protein
VALLLALAAAGCCDPLKPQEEAAVQTWLECQDCESGALDSVLILGRCAVPRFAEALHAGPTAPQLATYRTYLLALYGTVRKDTTAVGSTPSLAAMNAVAAVLGNYRVQYRSHAAYALGRIGGTDAVRALDSALADSTNTGILRTDIMAARALAGGP